MAAPHALSIGLTTVVLSLGVVAQSSPGAGAQPAPGSTWRGSPKVAGDPVGTYSEVSSNGGTGNLTLVGGGTFTTDYGDSGVWVTLKTSIALVVSDSDEDDDGCVYLGTLDKAGINTATKQGPTTCDGTEDTWYALKEVKQNRASVSSTVRAAVPRVRMVGNYSVVFDDEPPSPMVIAGDRSVTAGDQRGFWVAKGKAIAFSFTGSSTCVALGLADAHGFDSEAKPGPFACAGESGDGYWYAMKTTASGRRLSDARRVSRGR